MNSAIHAIQIKLFSSGGSTLLIGGGGALFQTLRFGGWGLVLNFFFLRPFGPQFGLKIRRAPPLDPPLFSKAPILQGMNDDAGIKKKEKQSTFS